MFGSPDRPPTPKEPRRADASVVEAGQRELQRYASLASAAGQQDTSLKRKAKTDKPSLIGS